MRRIPVARGAPVVVMSFLAVCLCLAGGVKTVAAQETRPAEPERTAEWYAERALAAVESENYDRAVQLLKEGQERYPEAVRLYVTLGDLYFDEELYRLSLEEYKEAERIEPNNFSVLHSAALALGRLNQEQESVRYLERVLDLYPDSPDVIADLGWMYFKTHQLEKGEELLLDAIEEYGHERSLTMTLGTIYADMYEFEKSKAQYERSIESALEDGRSYFASVAYYNLSLLQKAFFRFNGAMRSTQESLAQAERATGHLAKGELYEMQMDFRRAHDEYTAAYNLDEETPLAKLDLAALYRTFGRLDEALAYARDVYESDDLHWMFNFGTDERRHHMELHDLLSRIHRGKARVLKYRPATGIGDWLSNTLQRIHHRIVAWYHEMTFRRYATGVARSYEEEGSRLNAQWTFYRAHSGYPRLAERYLARARELETQAIPEADSFYAMEAAVLREDPARIADAINAMHPRWERATISEGLREIALIARRRGETERAVDAAVELYRMNHGGLRQHRLELPVSFVVVDDAGATRGAVARVRGLLERSGLRHEPSSPLELQLRGFSDRRVSYRLVDEERFLVGDTFELAGTGRRAVVEAARRIADRVFQVE